MKELEIKLEHYTKPKHLHSEYCNKNANQIIGCNFYDTRICLFKCRYAKVMNNFKLEAEKGIVKMAGQSMEVIG